MATCENDLPPGDVLESSPSEALVAHNYPDSPSKVSPAPYAVITRDDRQPDSYIRASARLTSRQSSEGKLSASAVPRSRNRQDFDDSGIYENGLEPIATLGMNQLSQYTFTPTHHPEGSVDSNLAQEELRSSRDKAEFIISLKNELKKHNTIPSNFNKLGFFQELYKLLADDVWEIRNESTLLIHDLLPYLKRDLDSCVSIVLPNIVPNLGHPRTTLQKSTVQMLTSYASMTRDKQSLVEDLTAYGVNHENKNTSKNATVNLKYILNEDFSDVDMSSLAESLFRKLYDPELKDPAVASIKRLRYMVGQERFDDYLHRLTPRSRSKANNILLDSGGSKISIPTNTVEEVDEEEEEGGEEGDDEDEDDEEVEEEEEEEEEEEDTAEEEEREEEEDNEHGEDGDDEEDDDDDDVIIYKGVTSNFRRSSTRWIEFGFVDGAVMEKIRNEKDWKTRSEGCEQLRELVRNISDITPLLPHLPHFLVLLDTLIDDYNFRISMTVLDIYRILIDKLQSQLPAYLRQIVHSVMKHVGDPKVVVRIENMKVFQKLLQAAQPRLVVPILCDQLNHRVTKIREDCLNLLIYALMTHPSYEFDLSYVAEKVGPTVADPKRRVRQASLECLAVIAQFLGPARLGPLMAAVDRAEDQENLDGAMAAVQARLARRKLPKVSPDGLIEYALSIPSSTRRTKLSLPKGADVEWVMAGTGTTTGGTLSSSSSLGSSLAVSDSQVNSLSLTHPQSSPSPRSRTAHLDDSLQRKRSFSDVELNRSSSRAWGCRAPAHAGNVSAHVLPPTTGEPGALGPSGDTSIALPRPPTPPSPDSPLLLGAPLKATTPRSRSLPGLPPSSRGLRSPPIRRQRSLSSVPTVLPPATAHNHTIPPLEPRQLSGNTLTTAASLTRGPSGHHRAQGSLGHEEGGMWKMVCGAPHWDAAPKKMWSPGPPVPREPVKLPFLEVTPTTVIQRIRNRSIDNHSDEDDRSLALWTTDTLDLSRTAPNDLGGYRGVYLGKLRQGSSYSRGISVEKGYSLLPNKYGTGGLGSARGDRPGSRSPNMMSPTLPRRINALAPLETGAEALVVTRAGSTRGIIPPLSAVSRRSVKSNHKDIISDAEEEEDDEVEDRRSRYDYEDDDDIEEEEVEEVLAEDGRSSRPKSSATTRDSGISIFSVSNDGDLLTENGSIRDEGRQQEVTSRASSRHVHSKGGSPASSIPSPNGRNSYELGPTRIRKVGDLASPSSHSLPNESLRNSGFGVVGKGYNSRSRNGTGDREFRSFDYESDFETDEEDPHSVTLSNTTLTKMKLLKKKRENQREIERRRFERDTKRSQEERTRKYRELELQHSGSSLQPTRANSGESNLAVQPNLSYKGRSPRTSPRPSPRPSPQPNRRTSPGGSPDRRARIPKSKSYTSSLNRTRGRGGGLAEKRHRSLERNVPQSNGGVPGNTYRTPQLVRRGQPPANSGNSNLSNSFGTTRRLPRRPAERSEDLGATMTTAGLRSAKPSSSCFKAHLEPFANPQEALRKAQQDINSGNWESQVDGIQDIVRLIEHHPEVIQTDLHSINMGLLKQAKNLRSQVSRASMQAFTYLFDVMKRQMEPDVEKITSLLLHKTSDTNKFLQLDSHHGLDALVENVSPNKAIPAIVHEGLTHKNPAVRTTVARLLAYEVERLGPTRALSGQKDITDRLLPAAAKLAQEGSLETRKYAKQIFQQLKQQPGFDAALKKYVPHNDIRNIQKFLDNLYNEARTIQDSARSKFSVGSRYSRTM